MRVGLRVARRGVDLDFAAHGRTGGVVTLQEDAILVVARRILVVRGPDDDIAAIGQRGDGALVLRTGREAVGLHLVVDRDPPVGLGRDGQIDGLAYKAAIAVGDLDRDQPRRVGIVGGIGVAQSLDQLFDTRRSSVCVERHDELRAVCAVTVQCADDRATDRHISTGDRYRAAGQEAELILSFGVLIRELPLHLIVVDHGDVQLAAAQIRAVGIAQADRGGQRLRTRVHVRLGEGHTVGYPDQNRVFRRWQKRRVGKHLLEYAVARSVACRAGCGRRPDDRETAIGQSHCRWLGLIARKLCIDLEFPVDAVAIGRVDLRKHTAATAVIAAVVIPGDQPAAVVERDDIGLILVRHRRFVHPHLAADRSARAVIALHLDRSAGAIDRIVVAPDRHETAIAKRCDLHLVLRAGRQGIDDELSPRGRAVGIEDATEDAKSAAVTGGSGGRRLPHGDVAVVGEHGDRGEVLIAGRFDIHLHGGRRDLRAGIVELDDEDAVAAAVGTAPVGVGDKDVAVRLCRDIRRIGQNAALDPDLAGHRRAGLVEDPQFDVLLARTVLEDDREAAGRKPDDARLALVLEGLVVDAEFRADRCSVQAEELAVDAKGAVLHLILLAAAPDHDITGLIAETVVDSRGRRHLLVVRRKGVDLVFTADRYLHAVDLGGDVHGHDLRSGRTAIAVSDLQRDIACRVRVAAVVAVAQLRCHPLRQFRGRAGIEGDDQRRAVLAIAVDGADGRAVDRYGRAEDSHPVADHQTDIVLRRPLACAQLGIEGVTGADKRIREQLSAVKVGGIRIRQAQRAVLVEQLQARVDLGLGKAHRVVKALQHRALRPRRQGGLIEQLLEYAVLRPVARRAGGECREDNGECAIVQLGCIGLILCRGGLGIDLIVHSVRAAVGIEILSEDTPATAVQPAAVRPDDREAAIGPAHHHRVFLMSAGCDVDDELAALRHTVDVVDLGCDVIAADTGHFPHDDEAAVGQGRAGGQRADIGFFLIARRGGVDAQLPGTGRRAIDGDEVARRAIDALHVDAIPIAVVAVAIFPDHENIAIGQFGDPRTQLLAEGRRIDLELAA